jgi:hypothetical protein
MIPWKYLVLVACLFLAARAAQAKDVDAKERAAKTACLSGDYVKGGDLLSELYVSTKNPVYVYNQGRCFEQNHRYEDAISRFREYLRVGKLGSKTDKVDVQKHISECEGLLAKQGGASSTTEGAEAGNGDSKTAKERAAKKACLTGDADAGVALLADLYVDTNDANHIFNQGRCLEQVGRCEDAILRFREYLRKTKDSGKVSDGRAERHIADCEEILKKTKGPEGHRHQPMFPSRSGELPRPRPRPAPRTRGTPNSAGSSQTMGASQAQADVQASLSSDDAGAKSSRDGRDHVWRRRRWRRRWLGLGLGCQPPGERAGGKPQQLSAEQGEHARELRKRKHGRLCRRRRLRRWRCASLLSRLEAGP